MNDVPGHGNRARLREAQRVVVKIGSALLTNDSPTIDRAYLHDAATQLAGLSASGREIILVSSGAVAAGVGALDLASRPDDVARLQAAAAAGQPALMSMWREAFGVRDAAVAQMLLSRSDFDERDRFLNIRNCVASLLDVGCLPIVNENDSVATEEISLGDNDLLAAKLSAAVRADALVILTTVEGVRDEAGEVIREAPDADQLAGHIRAGGTRMGRGGMRTKLQAARDAALAGVTTVIAGGRPITNLARVLNGDDVGTLIPGLASRHGGRRLWIALTATPAGTIDVDPGAAKAICVRGASLLAKGITAVTGRFDAGDVVLVRDGHGKEIARGLCNFDAADLRRIMGRDSAEFEGILGLRTHDEAVHRDNLAVTGRSGPAA
ncbi:MAG: glutamate 5-kinase [Planctomycetota bacterium]